MPLNQAILNKSMRKLLLYPYKISHFNVSISLKLTFHDIGVSTWMLLTTECVLGVEIINDRKIHQHRLDLDFYGNITSSKKV